MKSSHGQRWASSECVWAQAPARLCAPLPRNYRRSYVIAANGPAHGRGASQVPHLPSVHPVAT